MSEEVSENTVTGVYCFAGLICLSVGLGVLFGAAYGWLSAAGWMIAAGALRVRNEEKQEKENR